MKHEGFNEDAEKMITTVKHAIDNGEGCRVRLSCSSVQIFLFSISKN